MLLFFTSPLTRSLAIAALGLGLIAASVPVRAQDSLVLEEHFSVEKPADLSPDEAEAIYRRVSSDMIDAYGLSRDPSALAYRRWTRFNNAPYPAATHGSRYVNNYGNGLAKSYGRPETPFALPEGAVLAKDSFAVTEKGDVFLGPLFLMEKMAPGFNPASRDWRYSMIMPDGSLFGATDGENAERVRFCITCHETAGDDYDHLFFVPEAFRVARPPR